MLIRLSYSRAKEKRTLCFGNSCFLKSHQAEGKVTTAVGSNSMVMSTAFDTDPKFVA